MKILVTGANGQLGSEIRVLYSSLANYQFTFIDIDQLDLTSPEATSAFFEKNRFDIIVNCAAYTAVDKAEEEKELAYRVNFEAVNHLIQAALRFSIRLIHISTDYVFDGHGNRLLVETSQTNPLSVYGKSKEEADKIISAKLPNAYILRTSWVYSTFGKNFVKTIANAAKNRPALDVVSDQIGSPTYARDLAEVILTIIKNISTKENDVPGLYHYSNDGVTSWYDFAYFIVRYYKLPCVVRPIRTEQYKTLATRPRFSVMDKSKIKQTLNIQIPHWHQSLTDCLELMAL